MHIKIFIDRCICTLVYIRVIKYTSISLLCQLRGPESNDTTLAMSIPNTQCWLLILFLNNNNNKEQGLFREMVDSRTGAGNVQHEPEISYSARK